MQLRFDVNSATSLSPAVKLRLKRLAGTRLTKMGVIVIEARHYRTRERNRKDARLRLADLIERAKIPPTPRKKTKLPFAATRKRLEAKKRRGNTKQGRQKPSTLD